MVDKLCNDYVVYVICIRVRRCGTQAWRCKRDSCGFDSLITKYLIFSFRRSSNEAKRGVVFRDNMLWIKNSAETGVWKYLDEEECLSTRLPLLILLRAGYSMKLKVFICMLKSLCNIICVKFKDKRIINYVASS